MISGSGLPPRTPSPEEVTDIKTRTFTSWSQRAWHERRTCPRRPATSVFGIRYSITASTTFVLSSLEYVFMQPCCSKVNHPATRRYSP